MFLPVAENICSWLHSCMRHTLGYYIVTTTTESKFCAVNRAFAISIRTNKYHMQFNAMLRQYAH